jgi:hypothetical protein
VTHSCTPLSRAEVPRRRAERLAFSLPQRPDGESRRDENDQQDEVLA